MNDNNQNSSEQEVEVAEVVETKSVETQEVKKAAAPVKILTASQKLELVKKQNIKSNLPKFRVGDTVKVSVRIVEGNKERIQAYEGIVIKRSGAESHNATFTVRKISYNIGVERTFLLHSPRIEKIELVNRGIVRRARLFYLRPLRGKAARVRTQFMNKAKANEVEAQETDIQDVSAE